MIKICHNSHKEIFRHPFGAVTPKTSIFLALEMDEQNWNCALKVWSHEGFDEIFPMNEEFIPPSLTRFFFQLQTPETPNTLFYYFILTNNTGFQLFYGNNENRHGGEGKLYEANPIPFQITVYEFAETPNWYKNSIVYQIFPDRFCRSDDWRERQESAEKPSNWKDAKRLIHQSWSDLPNYTKNPAGEVTRWGFFGGTLLGIQEKLLYLKSMGISAIYLNPIFEANSNHKYDTSDYMKIDSSFGDEESFCDLAKAAEKLGISLILDGVFSHTGANSVYFNKQGNYSTIGAAQGEASKYYDWYRFKDFPDSYECWWGVSDLPNVEENNPSYREFIYRNEDSVIRHWLKLGAKGWRLDVADELPDDFIQELRLALKETDPEALLLGEVWEDASNKMSYGEIRKYLLGSELDSTMNYPFRAIMIDFMLGKVSSSMVAGTISSLMENYPTENFYAALNLIGSHDRERILTVLGEPVIPSSDIEKEYFKLSVEQLALSKARLKVLSLLQFCSPGVPSIYYGDEAGNQGFADPFNRGTFPWGSEDNELLEHFRFLGNLRNEYKALLDGEFETITFSEEIYSFWRYNQNCRMLILGNRSSKTISITLDISEAYILDVLTSTVYEKVDNKVEIHVGSLSSMVLYLQHDSPKILELPRSAGVLCHISSLPSNYDNGVLGSEAKAFIDFLSESEQKLWQILPLNPAGDGNSPYSSTALFAGDIRFIDPDLEVNVEVHNKEYKTFCSENAFWLDDYALFMALKDSFGGKPWQQWAEPERYRTNLSECLKKFDKPMSKYKNQQFNFWKQWQSIKGYANLKGIKIIGDLPIYASADSVDVWAHRELFLLDDFGYPTLGAGVPPDYFSIDGQKWDNPIYNWDAMVGDNFLWWEKRFSQAIENYDYIRLDHFRSFAAFYAIPKGESAKNGYWLKGAGIDFFDCMKKKLGDLPILAEDLGTLDVAVYNLLKLTGFAGMNVYQFSANEMKDMPLDLALNRVFYTGTHDNQTLTDWCKENYPNEDIALFTKEIFESLYNSSAGFVILPLQDILGLGDETRLNVPGISEGNWTWQVEGEVFKNDKLFSLKSMIFQSKR